MEETLNNYDQDQFEREIHSSLTSDSKTIKSAGRLKLESWLNKNMRIEMSDGRLLIGIFLCTDQAKNVILGSCHEYLKPNDDGIEEEPRFLGLAMVPGHHIISIMIDDTAMLTSDIL